MFINTEFCLGVKLNYLRTFKSDPSGVAFGSLAQTHAQSRAHWGEESSVYST